MELVRHLVLLLHLVGFAALFGGLLVQLRCREPEINAAMLHGSYTMLITGVALAAFAETSTGAVDTAQLAVKLVVTVIVTILVVVNRRFTSIPKGLWGLLGALTLGNAAIAIIWQ